MKVLPGLKHENKRTYVIPKYRGLQTEQAIKLAAHEVSDDGRCWWIKMYLIMNSIQKWKGGRS